MNRKEIVTISSFGLVFILTSLLLRDLFQADNVALAGAIGGVTGLLAFFWGFFFIKEQALKKQIIYTVAYCAIILAVARYLADKRRENQPMQRVSSEVTRFNFESDLPGNWISPSAGGTDPELTLQFDSSDSLLLIVDGAKYPYLYEIELPDEILIWDNNNTIKFDWTVTKLNSDSLIISSRKGVIKLKRLNQ